MREESGDSYELSLIGCKCIGAYVRSKKNQNQVRYLMKCYLLVLIYQFNILNCEYVFLDADLLDMEKSSITGR